MLLNPYVFDTTTGPAWPITPLTILDPSTGSGFGIPNSVLGGPTFSRNMFVWSKGEIRNNGSTVLPAVTRFYNGTGGARLLWTNASNVFNFQGTTSNGPPPAGSYTARFDIYSNTGIVQNLRLGSLSAPSDPTPITAPVARASRTKTVVTDGTNYVTFGIYNDGGASLPDVTIENIEWYPTADLPAAYEDVRNFEHRRRVNFPNGTKYAADGALDNTQGYGTTGAGGYGLIAAPQQLTATVDTDGYFLASWSYLIICKTRSATAASNVLLGSEANAALGTTVNSLQFGVRQTDGRPVTQPQNFGVSQVSTLGAGYRIWGASTAPGERAVYMGKWLMSWAGTATYAGIKFRQLLHGGNATTSQYDGTEAILVIFPRALTATEWAQANDMAEYVVQSHLGITLDRPAFGYMGAGDSITAGPGPEQSYCSLQGKGLNFAGGTFNLPTRNLGVSGYGIADIEAILNGNNPATGTGLPVGPGGIIGRITEMRADGMQPLFSLMIGVNDSAYINTFGVPAFMTRLKAVWAAVRDAGSLVNGITNLPAGVGNNWNTNRLLIRTEILAARAAGLIDAVTDFGDPTSVMGNPANLTDLALWGADQLHPTALAHSTYLGPEEHAALVTLGVPA